MRLLLDTHVFLWAVAESRALKAPVRRLIESANEVYVSSASIWEIAIKSRLGKIDADPVELAQTIEPSGFLPLAVTASHAAGVAQLAPHHADPFDRLLISQSLQEPLRLVTADRLLAKYSDLVVVV